MSRRKRLIERNEVSEFARTATAYGTRAYADRTNTVGGPAPSYAAPNLQNASYGTPTGAYAGGAYGAGSNAYGGSYGAYNVASGDAYTATDPNAAYNTGRSRTRTRSRGSHQFGDR